MMADPQLDVTRPDTRDPFGPRDAMLGWVRDIAPYGIFTTDTDLVVQEWNEWLATHSGLMRDDVVGRSLLELFPDLLPRKLHDAFARALGGEVTVLSTALHRYLLPFPNPVREYGAHHMLQTARIAPLPANGRIVGTITIIEDVTQREYHASILRRQQEYDRLLSDALALLIASTDPLKTVADIFPRIAAPLRLDVYFNYSFEPGARELRLQSAGGVVPEVRRSMATVPVGVGLCGQLPQRRVPIVVPRIQSDPRRDAQQMRRLGLRCYAGFPLVIGEKVQGTLAFGSYAHDTMANDEVEFLAKLAQYVAIAADRAAREHALAETKARLAEHASDLESKVAERTAKLHESIAQLESFSYTVAHDLRAPIRAMTGFTDILLADFAPGLPGDAQEMLRRLRRASLKLDALTRDLLAFSRVMRHDVELETVDLDTLLADLRAENPLLAKGVLTIVTPVGTVQAQRTLLEQCFSNLFDNALKFARPGVPPQIRVWGEARAAASPGDAPAVRPPMIPATAPRRTQPADGPRLRVWVEDNGIGIAPDAFHRIWGVFERLPEATRIEGTGIGLAIVARAMQQMGGTCGVESERGKGTRFWLEFAVASPQGQ